MSKANFRPSAVDLRKEYFLLFWGSAWQNPMRGCPGGPRGPRELVDIQGQPLQGTGAVPSTVQEEQAWQKASTEEKSIAD